MVVAAGSGWGGEWPGNALVCSLLQGTLPVEKQGRADHLALPAFGSLFCPLFSSCPRLCGCLWRYLSIADILGVPTGAGRKVLEMVVSSRHTVTRHSCRCWRTDLVTAPPGVLISFVLSGDLSVCGRQVMWAYQVSSIEQGEV